MCRYSASCPATLLSSFIFLFALVPALSAQSGSVEDRLRALEQEVSTLRKENVTLRAELGLEGRAGQTIVKPSGREPMLSIGGLLQIQSDFGDKGDARFTTGNDRFYLRRARINLQGRFLEEFDFKIEGDFASSMGESTGNRAQLTDAFINWNKFAAANVKAGQFKTPFALEQFSSDSRLFAIERAMVTDRLAANRQLGLQVNGDLLDKRVSYATGFFNSTGTNTNANDNDKFMWAGRLSAVAYQGNIQDQDVRWSIGVDALTSNDSNFASQPAEFGFDSTPGGTRDNIFIGRRKAGGVDTQLHLGGFDLWAEYLRARFQPVTGIPAAKLESDGWYVQGTYFVLPKTLQALVKYDIYDPNVDVAGNRTHIWTLGGTWYLKADDLKLQLNYLLSDIDGVARQNRKLILRLQSIF